MDVKEKRLKMYLYTANGYFIRSVCKGHTAHMCWFSQQNREKNKEKIMHAIKMKKQNE
jgi:hypothetical protein